MNQTIIFVCLLSVLVLVASVDVNSVCIANTYPSKGPIVGSTGTYQDEWIEKIDLSQMKSGRK